MMLPGTIEKVVVDTFRGQYRVRKWPPKRGTPTDPVQLQRIERFASANRLAKFVNGNFWQKAITMTNGTGLYPRDLLVQAMTTGLYDIVEPDGRLLTQKVWRLEMAEWQGVTLEKSSNQAYTASAAAVVVWNNPQVMTWPLWDAALPNRITIPANISMVELTASVRCNTAVAGFTQLSIRKNGSTLLASTNATSGAAPARQCTTGPIAVTNGDWFDVLYQGANANTIEAVDRTFFACTILTTVP